MHADPIYCYRPTPERAAEFAAPAYDVFDRAGAAAYVEAHPRSFLAIDRPETGFAPDHDMYAADVYEHARDLLNERVADGTLLRDEKPCYYVWRLATAESHTQTGIVAGVAVDDYEDGTVHRHEDVLKAKAQDRINHIRTTNAQTGPIFLAYRDDPTIDSLVALTTTGEPLYDFTAEDGCRHTIWRISREVAVQSLQLMFDRQVPDAYIADGHHRCASAVAVCEERRAAARDGKLDEAAAGADEFVRCVDVSQAAIDLAGENARLNKLDSTMGFTCANVLEYLPELAKDRARLREEGGPFDLIVLDPPAFTKSRGTVNHASKGYREINQAAMRLLPRGGYLATCSCSHFMTRDLLAKAIAEAAHNANVQLKQVQELQQAPDHPILWGVPETHYLDFFIFQVI